MLKQLSHLIFIAILCTLLLACGGGGDAPAGDDNLGGDGGGAPTDDGAGGGGGSGDGASTPVDPPTVNLGAGFNKARGFNDVVRNIVPATDGSGDIYVSGQISSYNNSAVDRLARLNNDGSIDNDFTTAGGFGRVGTVVSLAPTTDGSGDVYVGGFLNSYNNTVINNLIRLNSDGSLDSSFITSSGFNSGVLSLALATDGSDDIYVGGAFTSYNGTTVNNFVRLNSDGSLDAVFDTFTGSGFNGDVLSIAPTTDGSGDVYAIGRFTSYNGITANHLLRLNNDGSIDSNFITGSGINTAIDTIILAIDGSGDIYIGGNFSSYNGTAVRRLVRLNNDGSLDSDFDTSTDGGLGGMVNSIALANDGSGDIYVGGFFSYYRDTPVNALLRLNNDGSLDRNFDTFSKGFKEYRTVESIALAPDGSSDIYVGGIFWSYNGTAFNYLVRINNDGGIDIDSGIPIGSGFQGGVVSLLPVNDSSGDVYVAGGFYNDTAGGLLRLNGDGSIDSGFDASTDGGFGLGGGISSIALTTDDSGDLFVGGSFRSYRGNILFSRLVRLNSDGSVDSDFNLGFSYVGGNVNTIALATDGSGDVYVGGEFIDPTDHLVRLNADGSLDSDFYIDTGFDGNVTHIAPATDGSGDIYVSGEFTTFMGSAVNNLLRLNSDGSLDSDFDTSTGFVVGEGFKSIVESIILANDDSGDIYVGGQFSSYGDTAVNSLVRLNSDGSLDSGFDTSTGGGISNGASVESIALADDGSGDVFVGGGWISIYNGVTANSLIRLNNDGSIDNRFTTGAGFSRIRIGTVNSIVPATDGSGDVYFGGAFSSYNGTTVGNVMRLDPDGTVN